MSIPYTKALLRLTPLSVSESAVCVGRSVVTLRAEYVDGETSEIYLLLPERGKRGDSMTVSHTLYLAGMDDDPEAAETFDRVLRTVGFRPEAERVN